MNTRLAATHHQWRERSAMTTVMPEPSRPIGKRPLSGAHMASKAPKLPIRKVREQATHTGPDHRRGPTLLSLRPSLSGTASP